MTQPNIRRIKTTAPENKIIRAAADVLNRDGVIVVPTETRYGLAVRTDHRRAFQKVFDIKSRGMENPSAIFIKNVEDISEYALETDVSRRLTAKFLPGALTLVLRARGDLDNPAIHNGKIGLRVSSSPVIAALLGAVDFDLTATSANKSGAENPETIKEVAAIFGDEVDLYLDGGRFDGPVSTVVDCSSDRAVILREGAIGHDVIAGEVPV